MPFKGLGSLWRKHVPSGTPFQVVSDLHLEYCCQYTTFCLPACAPYLVLAGNTGRLTDYALYLDFLVNVCARFKKVFLVLGLLEHQGLTPKDVERLSIRLQHEETLRERLVVLNQSKVRLNPTLTILGSSVFPESEPSTKYSNRDAESNFLGITGWSPFDNAQARRTQFEWLRSELQALKAEKHTKHRVLVITNSFPERTLLQDETASGSSSSIMSIPTDVVPFWICGGDGESSGSDIKAINVVNNSRGLVTPFEDTNTAYSRESGFGRRGSMLLQGSRIKGFDAHKVIRI